MCCLYGLIDCGNSLNARQRNRILTVLGTECEARGTDAAGIAYNSRRQLRVYKQPGPARKLHICLPGDAKVIMGHTRMTTQGSEKRNFNNHPFLGCAGGKHFALAHNGVLWNDRELRCSLKLPQTKIETDSYIGVQLVEHKKALDFDSLKYMAEQVEGSFTFTLLDQNDNLYIVKGDNPLCLYHYPKSRLFLYASTESILEEALEKLDFKPEEPKRFELHTGDILRIDRTAAVTWDKFDTSKLTDLFWPAHYCRPVQRSCAIDSLTDFEVEYLDELRSVAVYLGFAPEFVDRAYREGFDPEEIEEFIYENAPYAY